IFQKRLELASSLISKIFFNQQTHIHHDSNIKMIICQLFSAYQLSFFANKIKNEIISKPDELFCFQKAD
ncbi:MAG: hypothetical protein ACOCW7_03680, partial [Bacteroidota bacterium]